jgi:hypothetical protein
MFALKLNAALGSLGIDPRIINQPHRDAARMLGESTGQTPQEVALLLLTQLPSHFQSMARPSVARKWAKAGKINVANQAVSEALIALSWHNREWTSIRPSDGEISNYPH